MRSSSPKSYRKSPSTGSDAIPAGSPVFIDANIFIYHFTGVSEECSQLLRRCEAGELKGITSVNILAEVLHRLMMLEAVQKRLVTSGNVASKLKERPEVVKALDQYYTNAMKILEMGIEVSPLTTDLIRTSQKFRKQFGFMTNDSLVLASMEEMNVKNLATYDRDFKRVKGIRISSPQDVRAALS